MAKKWFENPYVWVGVVALVIVLWLVWPNPVGEYDGFAQCLTEEGATMYGTEWCSHCKDQKSLFGASFKNINFVDCDRQKDACLIAGVSGYPTWKINGQNYPGKQAFLRLGELTGCEVVKDE